MTFLTKNCARKTQGWFGCCSLVLSIFIFPVVGAGVEKNSEIQLSFLTKQKQSFGFQPQFTSNLLP